MYSIVCCYCVMIDGNDILINETISIYSSNIIYTIHVTDRLLITRPIVK